MSQNCCNYGKDFEDCEQLITNYGAIFHQAHQRNCGKAFQNIECKNRDSSLTAKNSQGIGGAGIFAAIFTHINSVISLTDPPSAGN